MKRKMPQRGDCGGVKSREMLEGLPDLKPEESSLPKPIAVPLPSCHQLELNSSQAEMGSVINLLYTIFY